MDSTTSNEEIAEWAKVRGMLRKHPPSGFASLDENLRKRGMSTRMQAALEGMIRARPSLLGMRDIDGRTALHWIARYDAPELIGKLLDMGADPLDVPPSRTAFADTPLSEAAAFSWGPGLALLARAAGLDARAIPSRRAYERHIDERSTDFERASRLFGAGALHVAAMNCNRRAIEELLALGANPMLLDDEGLSPLHPLCMHAKKIENSRPCADLLLEACPKLLETRSSAGLLPHDMAESCANPLGPYLRSRLEAISISSSTPSIPSTPRARARPL